MPEISKIGLNRPSCERAGAVMLWDDFQLGFWHPFGPYTGLSVGEILQWKRDEIERHGWTFWSFAHSNLSDWAGLLQSSTGSIYVLCSDSTRARDPDIYKGQRLATAYQYVDCETWEAMPDPTIMKVTNPFKRMGLAVAFKVRRVIAIEPSEVPPVSVEWYAKKERRWRGDRLPTRGEFLIQRGGTHRPRRVSAVLELTPPYLALLRSSEGAPSWR